MSATGWIDEIQQGIADKLGADLPAKLDVLETAYNDGIALEDPAEIWPCDKAQINSSPAVEVWCPDANRSNDDAATLEYLHRITVVWTITGTDEVEIDKRIKRYLLATIRVLDGQEIGGAGPLIAGPMTFLVVDRDTEGAPWTRTAAVEFTTRAFASLDETGG